MLKNIFKFLKSRAFLLSLGIYLVLLLIALLGILSWMRSYTNHEEFILVPSFKDVKIQELDAFVEENDLRYQIIDSIYDPKSKPGIVVGQDPLVGEKVKSNRVIYLYVTSTAPPRVAMPELVDRSLRHAAAIITSYGFKLGETEFIPDPCTNCVLKQKVKGKEIEPGTMIRKGTSIDLVIGKGLSDEEVKVPCFIGLTTKEVIQKLSEVSLSLGAVSYDNPRDSASAQVYKQMPDYDQDAVLKMGEPVDLYFTTEKEKIPERPKDL